ncbi:MAG: CotH kinase family protein [Defluviitaleaceae bacterium]|nr:CotH kinase family protein [Defluviitaleaceae bacterium]
MFKLIILAAIFFTACGGGDLPEAGNNFADSRYNTGAALTSGAAYVPEVLIMPDGVRDFPSLRLLSVRDPFTQERAFWHEGYVSITGAAEDYNFSAARAQIRGRGNSTWESGAEKRGLRLRFDTPRQMLDSGHEARDWILLANLFDMSLLRNYAAFFFADSLGGGEFVPFSRFVHLYVNDEYMGVYQLTDERDIGPGRLQLEFNADPAISDYFFELDGHIIGWLSEGNYEGVDYFRVENRAYNIRFPARRDRKGHVEYLRDFMHEVYAAAAARDFEEIQRLVDLPSFIDFYIVLELTKSIDVGNFSVFLQVRGAGEERRLYFGPVWDFDRSMGNMAYWTSPEFIFAGYYNVLMTELFSTPEVFELITARWNEIFGVYTVILLDRLAWLAETYQESFNRNFERHSHIFGERYGEEPYWFRMVPVQKQEIRDFPGQVEYLLAWLYARINWLNYYFNDGHLYALTYGQN